MTCRFIACAAFWARPLVQFKVSLLCASCYAVLAWFWTHIICATFKWRLKETCRILTLYWKQTQSWRGLKKSWQSLGPSRDHTAQKACWFEINTHRKISVCHRKTSKCAKRKHLSIKSIILVFGTLWLETNGNVWCCHGESLLGGERPPNLGRSFPLGSVVGIPRRPFGGLCWKNESRRESRSNMQACQNCLAGWSWPTASPNKRLEHDTNNNRTGFAPGDVLHRCSARHAVLCHSFDLDVECATTRPTEMTQRTTCTIEYEIHFEFFVCEAARTAARQQDTMQKIGSVPVTVSFGTVCMKQPLHFMLLVLTLFVRQTTS